MMRHQRPTLVIVSGLIVRAVGVLASIIGVFAAKGEGNRAELIRCSRFNKGFQCNRRSRETILFGIGR